MSGNDSWSVLDINKWLHPISGKDAETLLKGTDVNGSFLVRHGSSKQGSYTLTVRRGKDDFVHVKIYNNGDCYDVYDGSERNEFASLVELLYHYWTASGQLSEKNGSNVDLIYPLLNDSEQLNDKWFYGSITAKLAEKLLMRCQGADAEGTFLVRKRTSDSHQYVLSVCTGDKVEHIIVEHQGDQYFVKSEDVKHQFKSLSDLAAFYQTNFIQHQDSRHIRLLRPLLLMTVDHSGSKQKENKFLQEFNELQKEDTKNLNKLRTNGQKVENKEKNRYKNILPFDDTRVILNDGDPCVVGSDYINANYVCVPECTIKYIATQGCLAATVADFWRMVWQENTRVIVMVTELVEMGKNKCTLYWPKSVGSEVCHKVPKGHIVVRLEKETDRTDYRIREFCVAYEQSDESKLPHSEKRSVYQYHFTSWPDKSLPKKPEVLVRFVNQVVQRQAELRNIGPVVVHCSAGIGRTGTFIVVGFILHQIRKNGSSNVDIKGIVRHLRTQRAGMVQTEAQYKFLYDVLPFITKLSDQVEYANLPAAAATGDVPGAIYQNLDHVQN
jgi:protein tyrosine phosphatase